VKVITPTPLVAEAADVLAGFRDLVVEVGAAAVEVALSGTDTAITPTRDVDVVVPVAEAAAIVNALEADGLRRSDVPHERAFMWVRGDRKVQLVRAFHPFPSDVAKALPQNPVFGMAHETSSQVEVAFVFEPIRPRLRCANAACLLALKEAAFGRSGQALTRPSSATTTTPSSSSTPSAATSSVNGAWPVTRSGSSPVGPSPRLERAATPPPRLDAR
jgi:hypothetical protein